MVAFTKSAVDTARAKGHALMQKDDIYEAEGQYSRHIMEELRDEIGKHVSDFDVVMNALRALKVRTFKRDSWTSTAERFDMREEDSSRILKLLFESGAIGLVQSGGSRGGSTTVYHYEGRVVQIDEPGAQLQVHPALTKELGLTEKYSSRAAGRRAI